MKKILVFMAAMLILWVLAMVLLLKACGEAVDVIRDEGLKNVVEDVWCGEGKSCEE